MNRPTSAAGEIQGGLAQQTRLDPSRTEKRGVIAVARPIEGNVTHPFVERPPGDKIRIFSELDNRQSGKGPDVALMNRCAVELIDAPIVRLIIFKRTGRRIGCARVCRSAGGAVHLFIGLAEIHMMQFRRIARLPAQCYVRTDEFGMVGRRRFIGFSWGNEKVPDLAFPGAGDIGVVDLINPPKVIRAGRQTFRIGETGEADDYKVRCLVAPEQIRVTCGLVHVVKVLAYIHVMRDGKIPDFPAKIDPGVFVNRAVRRFGIAGIGISRSAQHGGLDLVLSADDIGDTHFIDDPVKTSAAVCLKAKVKVSRGRIDGRSARPLDIQFPIDVNPRVLGSGVISHGAMMPLI